MKRPDDNGCGTYIMYRAAGGRGHGGSGERGGSAHQPRPGGRLRQEHLPLQVPYRTVPVPVSFTLVSFHRQTLDWVKRAFFGGFR